MNENNEANGLIVKQKSNKGIIIVLIILVIGLAGYIAYDKFIAKDNKPETNETTENTTTKDESKNDNTTVDAKDNVPITDLTVGVYDISTEYADLFQGYVKDGNLYYVYDKKSTYSGEKSYNINHTISNGNIDAMQKYEGINNIKRIKIFNIGTGVNPCLFAITNEGNVYYGAIYEGINLKQVDLNGSKVDDIIRKTGNDEEAKFEAKLQDGTTTTISW